MVRAARPLENSKAHIRYLPHLNGQELRGIRNSEEHSDETGMDHQHNPCIGRSMALAQQRSESDGTAADSGRAANRGPRGAVATRLG
jgi:hypothetical protein